MTRWLPFPVLSVFLLGMWLLLNQTLSAGHIVLGSILAVAGPLAMSALELPSGRLRRPGAMLRLAGVVFVDIVRSNIVVARIILSRGYRTRTPGFLLIPLDLRNPHGLAVLACIITSTPGTIWVDFDSAKGRLMIHVLDLVDEATWIHTIKDRYERLLLEIFE
jgi:multicomponent K+:H+ antiporter subunit E